MMEATWLVPDSMLKKADGIAVYTDRHEGFAPQEASGFVQLHFFLHGCMLYSSSSRTTMLIDGMRGRLLVVPNYLQSLVASCGALASPRVDGGLAFVALLKLAFLELAATLFTVFVIVL
jgi:hypothetical protein